MTPPRWIVAAALAVGLCTPLAPVEAQVSTAQAAGGRAAWGPPTTQSCDKPDIPAGGLIVEKLYDHTVVYSDGYVTLGDLTRPVGPAPTCGWPLVVVVHGLPGSRINQRPLCELLAGQGYAAWAYEVRGQSQAIALNPGGAGFDWYGPDYKIDLAEQIRFVRETFPTVRQDRVAVTGNSQGAIHCWFAAAYSKKTVTAPGRGRVPFPLINCVVPFIFNADIHDQILREGKMFNDNFIQRVFSPDTSLLVKDPAFVANVQSAFLSQDPDSLLATWQAEPDRIWTDQFDTARGPVLWMQGYLDNSMPPTTGIEALAEFPRTTEVRAVLSTEGHQSPTNLYESDYRNDLRIRWLDRFLWGVQNQVELESPVTYAAMPTDENELVDPNSLWGHRADGQFAPADVVTTRFFFDAAGQLLPAAPASPGSRDVVHTKTTPGFGASDWATSVNQWNSLTNVLTEFPLDEVVLQSAPLAAESEIVGRPSFNVLVTPNGSRYQLATSLEAVFPGNSGPTQLGQWAVGVTDGTPGESERHTIDLPAINTVLPPGTVLQVRLRNLWINEAPMIQALQVVPYFDTVRMTVGMGAGAQSSFLNLPVRSDVRTSIKTSTTSLDLTNPTSTFLELEAGAARAGHTYQIVVGASGKVPGFQTAGTTVPVNPDKLTARVQGLIAQDDPALIGLEGVLDAAGNASAEIQWQNLPTLIPLVQDERIVIAALTTSGTDTSVSNPIDFPAK